MTVPAFRFAPSPNGELHLGHAYSALLNERLAREAGGRFLVRIEDIDTVRCTSLLAAQALEDLEWLGLSWETPVRYQSQHLATYAAQQDRLKDLGLLYPCFCTRKQIAERSAGLDLDPEGQPVYDGWCRVLTARVAQGRMAQGAAPAMRINMAATYPQLPGSLVPGLRRWGDVVLVRKDIGTSYHIAVVTDDTLQNITHVVRGQDLEAAAAIHILLQLLFGMPRPEYIHHNLISGETGEKLSKSKGSKSLRSLRAEGVTARAIRRALGFS